MCIWGSCFQRGYSASRRSASSHRPDGLFLGESEYTRKINEDQELWLYNLRQKFGVESPIAEREMYLSFLVMQELGLIRKPASFMTSICDERGQELIYAGMPITEVFKSEIGLGGTLGLLWFQRRLASWPSCCKNF